MVFGTGSCHDLLGIFTFLSSCVSFYPCAGKSAVRVAVKIYEILLTKKLNLEMD